jgi:hypothetical protein
VRVLSILAVQAAYGGYIAIAAVAGAGLVPINIP